MVHQFDSVAALFWLFNLPYTQTKPLIHTSESYGVLVPLKWDHLEDETSGIQMSVIMVNLFFLGILRNATFLPLWKMFKLQSEYFCVKILPQFTLTNKIHFYMHIVELTVIKLLPAFASFAFCITKLLKITVGFYLLSSLFKMTISVMGKSWVVVFEAADVQSWFLMVLRCCRKWLGKWQW